MEKWKKWEHDLTFYKYSLKPTAKELLAPDVMGDKGEGGWELVSVVNVNTGGNIMYFFWKREQLTKKK